jgi:hypothetical protein
MPKTHGYLFMEEGGQGWAKETTVVAPVKPLPGPKTREDSHIPPVPHPTVGHSPSFSLETNVSGFSSSLVIQATGDVKQKIRNHDAQAK